MANDILKAIDLYRQNSEPIELSTGIIQSVGSLNAQVAVKRTPKPQSCSFNSDMIVQRGDRVLLIRTSEDATWSVISVINRSRDGSSVVSRPTPNNTPGNPKWAASNSFGASAKTWSGTTLTSLVDVSAIFNGGTPALVLNGYAVPGGTTLDLNLFWGEGGNSFGMYRASLPAGTLYVPIPVFDVGSGPLYGLHTFNVRGSLSAGAISVTVAWLNLKLVEI